MELNQEDVLRSVQEKSYSSIIKALYEHRKTWSNDPMLQYSMSVFQSEFFLELKNEENDIFYDDLENLFMIHSGNFYRLSDENYQSLVVELAKRSQGEASVMYANLFPDNEACQQIIATSAIKSENESAQQLKVNPMNWITVYNRLFEIINNQGDQSTYFSGPRFIQTLREFDPYHADYNQYIDLRNQTGKSTSRKIFFYDIIMELEEATRTAFVNRILEMVDPFAGQQVIPIRALLNNAPIPQQQSVTKKEDLPEGTLRVFISYSWDNEEHKQWVLDLADNLVKNGVDVILDRYDLRAGKSLPHFVENSIQSANRIIMVFTPNYKLKAEKRSGGVGYEYSIVNSHLYADQINNDKVIPVLRNGEQSESVPQFMQQYIHIDMRNDDNYETSFTDLLREILDEPAIKKPELGERAKFE